MTEEQFDICLKHIQEVTIESVFGCTPYFNEPVKFKDIVKHNSEMGTKYFVFDDEFPYAVFRILHGKVQHRIDSNGGNRWYSKWYYLTDTQQAFLLCGNRNDLI